MVVQLTAALRDVFGEISTALLFEHRQLHSLAEHLVTSRPDTVRQVVDPAPVPTDAGPPAVPAHPPSGPARTPAVAAHPPSGPARAEAGRPSFRPMVTARVADDGPGPAPATVGEPSAPRADTTAGDIVIVGVAGRYPDAESVAEFWENLRSGRDSVTEVPADRWDYRLFGSDGDGNAPRWGGFLRGVDEFDPLFFAISPRKAEHLDPQEQLFLQCAYATLQDAGYTRAAAASAGPVGVFVGVMYQEYQLHAAQEQLRGRIVGIPGTTPRRWRIGCGPGPRQSQMIML